MTPLEFSAGLAGNPTQGPHYFVEIESKEPVYPVKEEQVQKIRLTDPRATRALVALMDMNAVLGGAASHYGGPAAFAELMSALHGFVFSMAQQKEVNWYDSFHIVNDAGHCENGLYALKANYGFAGLSFETLKGFRSIKSCLTGHGEAHLFPRGVQISNGPLGSAFPQAQGLAMADAKSKKDRVTFVAISDGACMEGEAREAFAAIPGFAQKGQVAPFVLIISDNNTKLSGRIDNESFSMGPSFQSLNSLGWEVIHLEDGHDLKACFETICRAYTLAKSNPRKPVVIHARTIKGIGSKKTAESPSGGHGFPLKGPSELPDFLTEIYDGAYPKEFDQWINELKALETEYKAMATKPSVPEEKIQGGISAAMIKSRQSGLPVVSITSDLPGSTGVAGFRKEFPDDSIDVGIAESNMISVAAGFSKMGYIPVVDTFAQFGVTKGALPLTMASLSLAPLIAVFSHTGFQDAADGASHQGLTYLSMTMGIPHVRVITLSCRDEAEAWMSQAINEFAEDRKKGVTPVTTIFFLGRENFPRSYRQINNYNIKESPVYFENLKENNITILASGSMVPQALAAAEELMMRQFGVIVIHAAQVTAPDWGTIEAAIKKTDGKLITIEDHQLIGGFGQRMISELVARKIKIKADLLAVHGEFGQSAYNAVELYKKHRLDAGALVEKAVKILNS